jgi:hypothetical protein
MMLDISKRLAARMIRYSSYGGTNHRTPSSLADPLRAAYRELLELRERVRNAEAAAAIRLGSHDAERLVRKNSQRST